MMYRFAPLIVLAALSMPAQEVTGSIAGTVLDPSGAAVAGAKITVRSLDRDVDVRSLTSNESGAYLASLLDVGKYAVKVEAKGFKSTQNTGIDLHVADKLTINFNLQVGDVSQEVTVEAATVAIDLQSGVQSTVVNGTQIRELALVTRNYEQLVALMPGVTTGSVDQLYVGTTLPSGTTAVIPFSINGARNSMNAWLVDGADNVDRGSNQTILNTPSIDAIAEFKVLRSGYSAEVGRAGGGQISVVTKSGTNQFHGDAYEFVRNNAFAANNFYNNATSLNLGPDGKANVAPLHYNNFGWTLGGPLVIPKVYDGKSDKHQTYFFFSQEFRRVITYASGTATLPTTAELTGNFPHPICISYTGSTCNQTATQITTINPVAQAYITDIYSKLPLPATGNGLTTLFRNVYNYEQELYKLDHVFSEKLRLSARFLRDQIPTTEPQGLFTASPVPGVPTTSTNAPGHNWTIHATSIFSPTWFNEAGYAYSYGAIISDPVGLINSTYSKDIKTNLPFPATINQVPTLAFGGGSSITGYGPYRDYNRNHNFYDNVSNVRGNHTFRAGFTFNNYQKTENAAGANAGSFTFSPASVPTGATTFEQAFANFLNGNVATFTQASIDVTPDIRMKQWELYALDDWKIRPNLTINIGLRYSMFRQPFDAKNMLTTFSPAAYNAANAAPLLSSGLLAPTAPIPYLNGIIINGQNSPFGSKIAAQDNKDLAPRLGFAWSPFKDNKTAVRGGYGLYYDATLVGTFEQNIFANPPFVNSVTIPNTTLSNPAGGTASISSSPKVLRGTTDDFKTPYMQQWSFEIQRQITRDTTVNAAYVGSKGTHLLGITDINTVYPGLAYSSGLIASTANITSANTPLLNLLRPYLGYNAINVIEPWFNSNYHSLQLSGQKNFSDGSLIAFAYTWSKALTDAQTDRSSAPQNFYNRHEAEYGPGTYDRKFVFNANFVYTLPFMRAQKGLVGKVAGGWQVAGIANYYTGLPYTVTSGTIDPAGLGILGSSAASLRPNLVCDPTVGALGTRYQWFNTACFQSVPAGVHVPGNAGRGVVRGPGYAGWNLAMSKNFVFRERYRLQIRGEGSNIFNQTNPSTFGSLATTSTLLGTVTGYRDPRIIQLGAKFYF